MSHSSIYFSCCLLGLILLSSGCATDSGPLSNPGVEAARRHADSVIRETRAESGATRTELAATRIMAAKKEAELQELRLEIAELREEAERKRNEFAALRMERDRLLEASHEFHVQRAELPELRQKAEEVRDKEAAAQRLKEVESALIDLSRDVHVQLADLPQLRQTASEAKVTERSMETRIKDLEAGMTSVLAEWQRVRTDTGQPKSPGTGARLGSRKTNHEQSGNSSGSTKTLAVAP
jgi:chromosome segregation ATPase